MGTNSDVTISAMLDKIMEDEEKKSKKKQKDIESNKRKENLGNGKEQIKNIPPHYGSPMVGIFPAYQNHREMHLKQVHPVPVNINPPHPSLPPNGSVPPQFHPSYSQPPPPLPIHNEIPHNLAGSNNSHLPNIAVPPPCEFFPPPPINHNPEIYGSVHHNLIPNAHHQNFHSFQESSAYVPFPTEPSNPSNYSSPYNNINSGMENDHKRMRVSSNSLPHSSIAAILPPPPSPPKLVTCNDSKSVTSSHRIHSPKRPYTPPPTCPTREFTQKRSFHSESKSSKIPSSPKHSVDKSSHHTYKKGRKSSEPPSKPYERKNYEDRKSSRYDKRDRDRRENSYERSKSEKEYKDRKYSESSYRYEKYGRSRDQKSRSREADHRSVNKNKHRQTFKDPVPEEGSKFNASGPQPSFNSFNKCPPFNPIVPSPFRPVKQETSHPVVEGMPFPPPGLNFTPVKRDSDSHFNSDLRPFDPPPPLKAPPYILAQIPPFSPPVQEGPLNIIPAQPPYNRMNEPPFIPLESQPFKDAFNEIGKVNEYSYPKVDCAPKSARSSRSHKNVKKRKHHKEPEEGIEYEDENDKSLKGKRKKEEMKKAKISENSKDSYELEPGECVSDSLSDISTSSFDDDSDSDDSSSTSSDTDDSLYNLEFLKNKKFKTTRFDASEKDVTDDNTVIKSAEKPKFPRYFKDKVAYCDDTSVANIDEPVEEFPFTDKSETPIPKIEEPKTPVSPTILCESLKATKTPLIKRLGLAQNGEELTKDDNEDNEYDTVSNENNLMLHREQENSEGHQLPSVTENVTNASVSGDISPFTFEQYMQRSNSLSPNNSLDFEEYKLLVSTKEILTASKSIFKSPTSPKSTTTKKKYEKPIIKVETASKPSPHREMKESPQRIDLDSRIRLMFGMKSSSDNSPEKKNFRNAAFSYKNMRVLSRPPSPFRNRSAYQFWHKETYYFRKNNPIPDVFFDPTQKRKFGPQSKRSKAKLLPRFLNLKEDYYQSKEIEPRHSSKIENKEACNVNKPSNDLVDNKLSINNIAGNNDVNQELQQAVNEGKTLSKPKKRDLHNTITKKLYVSTDSELELVSENNDDKVELSKLNIINKKPDRDSDDVVTLILSKIVEELKNEIKHKLTEEILEETFKINEENEQNLKYVSNESRTMKDTNERNEVRHRYQSGKYDLKTNLLQNDKNLHYKKQHEKS